MVEENFLKLLLFSGFATAIFFLFPKPILKKNFQPPNLLLG